MENQIATNELLRQMVEMLAQTIELQMQNEFQTSQRQKQHEAEMAEMRANFERSRQLHDKEMIELRSVLRQYISINL